MSLLNSYYDNGESNNTNGDNEQSSSNSTGGGASKEEIGYLSIHDEYVLNMYASKILRFVFLIYLLWCLFVVDTPHFQPEVYVKGLLKTKPMENLIKIDNEMVHDIKSLDSDMQMLVYENYNKFISATETIKRMKTNVVAMDDDMESVRVKVIRTKFRQINTLNYICSIILMVILIVILITFSLFNW